MDIKYRRDCEVTTDNMRERYYAHDEDQLSALFAPAATLCDQAWDEVREGDSRGLPPTGNAFQISVWWVYQFDSIGAPITTMRYDYDRARLFQQLGLLHDPDSTLGKTLTALMHPLTMAKVARRRRSDRPPAPQAAA